MDLCKQFKLTSDDIDKEVNDEHILKFYPLLENWKRLAVHLGLDQAKFRAIQYAAWPDEELMKLSILQEWKGEKKLEYKAKYQILLEALIKCNCLDSAVQVCGEWGRHTQLEVAVYFDVFIVAM